jgi:hypothetical protein
MNDFKIQYPLDLGSTHLINVLGGRGTWIEILILTVFFPAYIGPAYYLSVQRLFSIIFNLIFYGRCRDPSYLFTQDFSPNFFSDNSEVLTFYFG